MNGECTFSNKCGSTRLSLLPVTSEDFVHQKTITEKLTVRSASNYACAKLFCLFNSFLIYSETSNCVYLKEE